VRKPPAWHWKEYSPEAVRAAEELLTAAANVTDIGNSLPALPPELESACETAIEMMFPELSIHGGYRPPPEGLIPLGTVVLAPSVSITPEQQCPYYPPLLKEEMDKGYYWRSIGWMLTKKGEQGFPVPREAFLNANPFRFIPKVLDTTPKDVCWECRRAYSYELAASIAGTHPYKFAVPIPAGNWCGAHGGSTPLGTVSQRSLASQPWHVARRDWNKRFLQPSPPHDPTPMPHREDTPHPNETNRESTPSVGSIGPLYPDSDVDEIDFDFLSVHRFPRTPLGEPVCDACERRFFAVCRPQRYGIMCLYAIAPETEKVSLTIRQPGGKTAASVPPEER
jgi:hypothetical protein